MNPELPELITKAADRIEAVAGKQKALADQLEKSGAEFEARLHSLEQQGAHVPSGRKASGGAFLLADAIVRSPALEAFKRGETKNALIPLAESGVSLLRKDFLRSDGEGGIAPAVTYNPEIQMETGRPALSILDLLTTIPVMDGSYSYVVELEHNLSDDGEPDYQHAQGDTKATASARFERRTADIFTIASVSKAAEQVLQDIESLRTYIVSHSLYRLRAKAEAEVLSGASSSGIQGIATQATVFNTSNSSADAVGAAIAELRVDGWDASVVVLHPRDWFVIQSERATEGEYVAGGWSSPAAPTIWNVPVVLNRNLQEGTGLVMDRRAAAVLDRQRPTFAVGYVNDDFERNLITMRAEMRLGLVVYSPQAILQFDV